MKKFFLLATTIYLLGFVTALVTSNYFLTIKTNSLSFDYTASTCKSSADLFDEILLNNSQVYLACIAGFLTFGIYTALSTFYNGFVVGYLVVTLYRFFGNHSIILERLLPHSIEIVGIIISSTLGFYLAHFVAQQLFFHSNLKFEYNKVCILFIVGYLIILTSAFIESYVSAS